MNRYKYLLKNIGILTLSSFATKLIGVFLIPLYTNILTTTEYGTYDLFNATIGVMLPILTLNIQDSVMRFSLESKFDRRAIVSIGTKYLIFSNLIVIFILIVNAVFGFSAMARRYAVFFFLMFLSQSLSGVVTAYVRGIDRIVDLSVSSIIASLVTIGLNIGFLAGCKWGLAGYFLANILGPLVQCLYLIIRADIIHNASLKECFLDEKREMLDYCRPLIANSIAWWINSTSDRYAVIFFCGLAENGIYSMASKIPSILNILQSVFSQAWTLSAVHDFDSEDKSGFFSNTYRVYNCMLVITCSLIIVADKILAKFLYAKDFYIAWKYVPWLTIAIVFGALSGYIGGLFSAVKNAKFFAKSSIIGAVSNIVLNLFLTPFLGVLGASVATTVCYLEVWGLRYWHSKRLIKMKINLLRDVVSYSLLVTQAVVLLVGSNELMLYSIELAIFMLIVLLYGEDILKLMNKGKEATLGKFGGYRE